MFQAAILPHLSDRLRRIKRGRNGVIRSEKNGKKAPKKVKNRESERMEQKMPEMAGNRMNLLLLSGNCENAAEIVLFSQNIRLEKYAPIPFRLPYITIRKRLHRS